MDLAEQIEKLKTLHDSGALTDEEFAAAKHRLLIPSPLKNQSNFSNQYPRPTQESDQSLGRAANRFVSMQIIMSIIGGIVFLIFLFTVILPAFTRLRMGLPF